jgi:uncharacterized membrane protein YdjX (TVP38/TMEM64 family)
VTSTARQARGTLALLAVAAALVLAVPPVRGAALTFTRLLLAGDTEGLRAYLLGFGPWAPAVSALLMVAQSVVAPLPAFVITFTNGLLFGAFWGGLLSWSSAMVGAWVCFALARRLGRPAAVRLVGAGPLDAADRFFRRHGVQAIVLARLLPFVPFDPISYAAGLTMMSTARFLVGTGLGQLPATALYSWSGQESARAVDVLLAIAAATALVWVAGGLLRRALPGPVGAGQGRGGAP